MTADEIEKLIPDEVVQATRDNMLYNDGWNPPLDVVRAALAATLAAWPGVQHEQRKEWGKHSRLILPLKTETPNAE
jgi:hypothetical protein